MTDGPGWSELLAELDLWAAQERIATLWWRDDDATAPTAALEHLLKLSADWSVPLGLAVIPARMSAELGATLATASHTAVLQHGYCHADHAPAAEKKSEFGAHRPLSDLLADAGAGWARIVDLPRAAPIFVPPWNRWSPAMAPGLAALGLRAVSAYGARPCMLWAPGLAAINTHVDIIDWRGSRGFLGTSACLALMIDHLAQRRAGLRDPNETTGLLTHHLDHDDKSWMFLAELFSLLAEHPAARWLSPDIIVQSPLVGGAKEPDHGA